MSGIIYCGTCTQKKGKPIVRVVALFPLYCACGRIFASEKDGDHITETTDAMLASLALAPSSPCTHRGESEKSVACESCCGSVKVKVFQCDLHEECTIKKRAGELKTCLGCVDHESPSV